MGLFNNFLEKKRLERLKREVENEMTPENLTILINKYEELGDIENAIRLANEGLEAFPNSDSIFRLYYDIRKKQAAAEIEMYKNKIAKRPNLSSYTQLAEIYKDLREEPTALKFCQEAMKLFPNEDKPYLIFGEVHLGRFYKNLLIKEAKTAVENLEKAFEINNRNYKALLTLSKFYLQIGLINKARVRLKSILLFAPEDEKAKQLLEKSAKIPKPPQEDIDILLNQIEIQKKLYYNLNKEQQSNFTSSLSPEIFQKTLEYLGTIEEITALLICDEEGNLIVHHAKENIDIYTYYEIASSIYNAIQDSARQLELGRLERSELDGNFGRIRIIGRKGVIYVAFSSSKLKTEQLESYLEKALLKVIK